MDKSFSLRVNPPRSRFHPLYATHTSMEGYFYLEGVIYTSYGEILPGSKETTKEDPGIPGVSLVSPYTLQQVYHVIYNSLHAVTDFELAVQ